MFNRGHSLVKTFLEEMLAKVETLETVEKSKKLKKLQPKLIKPMMKMIRLEINLE